MRNYFCSTEIDRYELSNRAQGESIACAIIDSLKLRVIYDNLCWSRHTGISRKSRSLFLELDASAAKTGRPVTPVHPKTPTETSRRARDVSSVFFSPIIHIIFD